MDCLDHSLCSRRELIATAGAALAGAALGCAPSSGTRQTGALDLASLPNFCSHEHWGSFNSIGRSPEGFRADVEQGATPTRPTSLFDLLIDPYLGGWLRSAGVVVDDLAKNAGADDFWAWVERSPEDAWKALQPALARQDLTGTYQCTRRGIVHLYGTDILHLDVEALAKLNQAIQANYEKIFDWYHTAMRQAHFSELVRIVHPEYYAQKSSDETAAREFSFTRTIMRVDPLLGLWPAENERRDKLAGIAGVEPRDAKTWRDFIAKLFDLAAQNSALGIKQLQAYSRPLEYQVREDSQVRWRGNLEPEQVRVFQDWVMHECCRQADERGWVHQVHVGTHNITQSSPMPLQSLARRYPRMKIVMIHCWPFIEEAGWLAKQVPNIAIDTCWQPVLNPEFYRQSMTTWLNYVPLHKITCSHDSTSVEMATGSSLFTREVLGEVLAQRSRETGVGETDLMRAAAGFLQNNMVEIYGVGERHEV